MHNDKICAENATPKYTTIKFGQSTTQTIWDVLEKKLIWGPQSVIRMKREKQTEMENKVTIEKP